MRSLLEAPAPAALTTYRKDGSAHTVPVWYRWTGDAFEVVIAKGDVKLRHLARDPRCVLVVFEAVPAVSWRGGARGGRPGRGPRQLGAGRNRRPLSRRGRRQALRRRTAIQARGAAAAGPRQSTGIGSVGNPAILIDPEQHRTTPRRVWPAGWASCGLLALPDDPSVSVWTDKAPNVSRPDPSGAVS